MDTTALLRSLFAACDASKSGVLEPKEFTTAMELVASHFVSHLGETKPRSPRNVFDKIEGWGSMSDSFTVRTVFEGRLQWLLKRIFLSQLY